jgi:thioredoxin-related protein
MKASPNLRVIPLVAVLLSLTACDQLQQLASTGDKPAPRQTLDAPDEIKNLLLSHATQAARQDRHALLHFSLENCGTCRQLDQNVLARPEWQEFARARLVEVPLKFPSQFTSEDTELVQNIQTMDALAKHIGLSTGFPLLVVLGRDGTVLGGRGGYTADGAAGHVRWVQGLLANDAAPGKVATVESSATSEAQPTPSAPTAVTPAAAPVRSSEAAAPAATPAAPQPDQLKLGGLAGRTAVIHVNGRAVIIKQGETREVQMAGGQTTIHCREVGDGRVLIVVGNETEPRELRMP